jgi:hypothetical protein
MLRAVSGFIISRRILAAWGRLLETELALGTGIRGDPNLPSADVRPFEEVVRRSLSPQRFNVILLTAFSGLALLLATTGIYGVLSYAMNHRTAEIDLRVALGASPTNILGKLSAKACDPPSLACCSARSTQGGCRAIWTRCCSVLSPLTQ